MTTSDSLIAALEQNPSDFDLMAITADALEEDGEHELSVVFRWCAREKRCPYRTGASWSIDIRTKKSIHAQKGWYWYHTLAVYGDGTSQHIGKKWADQIDRDFKGYGFARWRETLRQSLEMLIPFIHEMQ